MRIVCDERNARAIADFIVETFDPTETAASAFEQDGGASWIVEIFFGDPPDEELVRGLVASAAGAEAAMAAQFSQIAKEDWVQSALAGLKPVRAGRIVVHGSHDRHRLRPNDLGIEIEAALAFGTGHHGTTLGCLEALDRIVKRRRPSAVLDVGTGTGVLAIAAAKRLRRFVASCDIDPIAVETARANAVANGMGAFVRPVVAAGVRHDDFLGRRFDLILANILAKPLMLMAPSLARVATPEAELVLSGLLIRDAPGVLAAYRAQGYFLRESREIEGWVTLVLKRGGCGSPLVAPLAAAGLDPKSQGSD